MSKIRLYQLISALLLVGNIALLLFIWQTGSHRPPKSPKDIIAVELELSKDQLLHYESLIKAHQKELMGIDERIRQTKHALFQSMASSSVDSVEMHIKEMGRLQEEIERIHVKHFTSLKNLCTAEQQPLFDELTEDLAKLLAPGKGKPPPSNAPGK